MTIAAVLTNEYHRRRAEADATGKCFLVTAFSLGNAGHDPLNPSVKLTPDPSATELESVVFGPKAVSGFDFANNRCPVWDCFLDFGEATTQFSSIGIYAQIIASPIPDDPEINTLFLYAIGHFGQVSKEDSETRTLQVGVQR